MKKKLCLTVSAIALSQVLAFGTAQAATTPSGYNQTNDVSVGANTGTGLGSTLPAVGNTLFQVQEGVYQATGTSMDHGYVWATVDGTPVLAVDPPKFIW